MRKFSLFLTAVLVALAFAGCNSEQEISETSSDSSLSITTSSTADYSHVSQYGLISMPSGQYTVAPIQTSGDLCEQGLFKKMGR